MTQSRALCPRNGITGQIILTIFAAAILLLISVSPARAIITPTKNPNLTEGRITIGLREELGDNTAEIERILLANPLVRIGWPSEFEISADPEYPDNFYLIDMNNPGASSVYRKYNDVPRYDVPATAESAFIGRLDDGSFTGDFERELTKIIRSKGIAQLNSPSYFMRTYLCIGFDKDDSCPGTAESHTFYTNDNLSLELRNENSKPQFVYLLMVKPDNELEWLFTTNGDKPIAAGESIRVNFGDDSFKLATTGRYRILTISTDSPINEKLLVFGDGGSIDWDSCVSVIERVLCEVVSGKRDETLAQEIWNVDSGWNVSVNTYYAEAPSVYYVGGGEIAPIGFAPWQVEIFSNLPYTSEQIKADRNLPKGKSKFLWKLSKFQQEHRCGGSLIAPDVVLTAAHCVAKGQFATGNRVLTERRVKVGTQNLAKGGAVYVIDSVVIHSGYRPEQPPNDIALLRIRPLDKKIAPRPILLPDAVSGLSEIKSGDLMQVLGWGYTGVVKGGERPELSEGQPQAYSEVLRIGNLEAMDLVACRKINNYASVNNKSICAVTPPSEHATTQTGNTFSCRGDSGGPVIRWQGSKQIQVGLVSWGVGCGAKANGSRQNPSVFVDVTQYSEWIKSAKRSFASGQVIRK